MGQRLCVAVVGFVFAACTDEVHVGGQHRLEAPAEATPLLRLADAAGTPYADGSLGTFDVASDGTIVYQAPLRVPAGGQARIVVDGTNKAVWELDLTEGRASYLRPFDAFANEPGGVAGLPALAKAAREDEAAGRARIIAELDRAAAAGLNTLFIEAYYHGYTMWPTTVGRQRPSTLSGGVTVYGAGGQLGGIVASTWDPLRVYLDEGHARGIEIHAWIEVFYVWTRYLQSAPFRVPSASSWMFAAHPDWFQRKRAVAGVNDANEVVSVFEDGKYFLDPRHPEVVAHVLALVDELTARYPDLDGVQLDYIRYPVHRSGTAPSWYGAGAYHDQFGFNPTTFPSFTAATGYTEADLDPTAPTGAAWDAFSAWKTAGVTELVAAVRERMLAAAPHARLSVSIFPNFAEGAAKMQDSRSWVNAGLVDLVMPQLYYTTLAAVEANGDPFLDEVRGKVLVYPTFYVPHFYDHASGAPRSEAAGYLSYAARRDVQGIGLFIQSGPTVGISAAVAADLTAPGAQFEHPARPPARAPLSSLTAAPALP